ncbi:MAG: hypothetical protein V4466_11170 [Pseudomonadota bacterium]
MLEDPEDRDRRRRQMEAAQGVYLVPAYRGHWVGAMLFAATLVGLTMLGSCLPAARAVLAGDVAGRTATTFLTLYAAMAVGPIAGWVLWGLRRRWAALAVVAIFAACVVWLSPAASL